jgi:toxoflavin biosynthesis protein ToxD
MAESENNSESYSKTGEIFARTPKMITIPAGSFFMGTSDKQADDLALAEDWAKEWLDNDMFQIEQPQCQVELPAFSIAQFPVTTIEYYAFVWNIGYRSPRGWASYHYPEVLAEHPVTGISKVDALAYIEWLNAETHSSYRLPSEAEWEKACRGELDKRVYPWGDEFDPWRCNTVESHKGGTTQVGSYSPGGDSIYKIADLVGNVWEWTSSFLIPYPYQPRLDRDNPGKPQKCVVRGGAWYYSHKLSRCSAREGVLPTFLSPSLGFRLAQSL